MKIAFLCKRKYMGKDVILDKYARLYEFPSQLSKLGNKVHCFVLDYGRGGAGVWNYSQNIGELIWFSKSLGRFKVIGILFYFTWLYSNLRQYRPEVIYAGSDVFQVVVGRIFSSIFRVPLVIDLYDNFESFGLAKIPFLKYFFRKSLAKARLITVVSPALKELIEELVSSRTKVVVLPSTIDDQKFYPRDKFNARKSLGLPLDKILVGTAGALSIEKGLADLIGAWEQVSGANNTVHLVLAGPKSDNVVLPQGYRAHYLGCLSHELIPELFSALDIGVICIPNNYFGKFSFPQKAFEMLACKLPIVASNVGSLAGLLKEYKHSLYLSGNSSDLASKILYAISAPVVVNIEISSWESLVQIIDKEIKEVVVHPIHR